MKKLIFIIIAIFLFLFIKNFLTFDNINKIFNTVQIFVYLLLAFWVWGQIFLINSNVIYSLFFLILKTIKNNISFVIFIFSISLLFFRQMYITKELLCIYLTIINFFPIFKNSNNEEYIKYSIKLICLSIIIFTDIFSIQSVDLTFKYILENQDINLFIIGLLFTKTLIHASFYTILLSCFYITLNDYFYKDKQITYKGIFISFLKNIFKNSN